VVLYPASCSSGKTRLEELRSNGRRLSLAWVGAAALGCALGPVIPALAKQWTVIMHAAHSTLRCAV
jgi:hypothetical protein